MCKPASFVLTENNVYWSLKTDSHDEILLEHDLRDSIAGKVQIVRCEITPPQGDYFLKPDEWNYRLDQDAVPEWYDAEKCEQRARLELNKWIKARVFQDVIGETEISDISVWVKKSQVKAYGSAQVNAYDSAHVEAYDSAHVKAYGSAHVEAYDSAQVKAYDSAHVTMSDQAMTIRRIDNKVHIISPGDIEFIRAEVSAP